MKGKGRNQFLAILLMFALSMSGSPAEPTSVLEISFAQVVADSEFIFEGKAVSKQRRIFRGQQFTYFTFAIIDVIKGPYTANTIELGFEGLEKGMPGMHIAGMIMPKIGEKGIYFVDSLSIKYGQPFTGWNQGYYLVVPSQQTGHEVVIPVDSGPSAITTAPTLSQFKQKVRNLMGKGQT